MHALSTALRLAQKQATAYKGSTKRKDPEGEASTRREEMRSRNHRLRECRTCRVVSVWLREELPRIDNSRKYRALSPKHARGKFWRITCFAVLKKYRKRGVASAALRAALEAIRKKGGGLVEAYPIDRWLTRAFGNESTNGTASMFRKVGFKTVASFGATRFSSHLLMRKTVRVARKKI